MENPGTLVVTARPDQLAFDHFDDMRRKLFPTGRNKVPAHISLFHNLPETLTRTLVEDLSRLLPEVSPVAQTTSVRFLGNGIAYVIAAPGLVQVHAALSANYAMHLIPQDRQRYQPHITVQNKANVTEARAVCDQLTGEFAPMPITLIAVDVWSYSPDGTWKLAETVPWSRHAGPVV